MGPRMFAGRWPIMKDSPWNRQTRAGKISMIPLGPYVHNGKGNYFDMESKLPDGTVRVLVEGQRRATLAKLSGEGDCLECTVDEVSEAATEGTETTALIV